MTRYMTEELGLDLGYVGFDFEELKEMEYYDHSYPYNPDTLYQVLIEMEDYYSPKKYVNPFKKNILLKNGYDSVEYLNQIEIEKGKDRYDFIALKPEIIKINYTSNI